MGAVWPNLGDSVCVGARQGPRVTRVRTMLMAVAGGSSSVPSGQEGGAGAAGSGTHCCFPARSVESRPQRRSQIFQRREDGRCVEAEDSKMWR